MSSTSSKPGTLNKNLLHLLPPLAVTLLMVSVLSFPLQARDDSAWYDQFMEGLPEDNRSCTTYFSDGLAPALQNGTAVVIDRSGKVLVEKGHVEISPYSEDRARILHQNRWGFIDQTGTTVIPEKFEDAGDFSNGLAAVKMNGAWGYIDKGGAWVIPPQFEKAAAFSEGVAAVQEPGKGPCFINTQGRVVIDNIAGASFREGMTISGRGVLTDKAGKVLRLNREYDWIFDFSEGLASTGYDGTGGFIDEDGGLAIDLKEGLADSFKEGLARIEIHNRWGFIDKSGRMVIAPLFNMARSFSEGIAPVRIGTKWRYIDKTGRTVIGPRFDDACAFSEGLAHVVVNHRQGYIDQNGKFIWSFP